MKNKKTIILLIVSVLFVSGFLLLNKTSSVKQIKLKELNYNVTYKEAFPNSNIRKSIILCIMRNRCGEEQYNSGMYTVEKYNAQHPGTYNTYIQYYMTREYANNSMFGSTISETEIEAKENETISKEDLDKIKILIPNQVGETIRNLDGIAYLKNLKVLCNFNLDVENLDLSHNKELETILFNTDSSSEISKIKKIIVEEDNKLKLLALELENETLDISKIKTLEVVILKNGNIKNIVLPNNIKKLDLAFNRISSIVLPETVEDVNLDANRITTIKIPSKVIKANISRNVISSIDLSDAINLERLESRFNPIESIDLTKSVNLKFIELYRANIKSKTIDFSNNPKLEIASLNYIMPMPPIYGRPPLPEPPMRLETLDFSNNPNLIGINAEKIGLKSIDLSKNLKLTYANINNNEIKDLKIPTTLKRNSIQNINFKIKKNSYIDLPILFNGEKVYLEDSDNFKRVNDKYIFDQVGTFNEKVKKEITDGYKYEANVTVEVESGEEETYTPTLSNQVDYKPEANKELSVNKIKEMVTNLPANIKNFEIISPEDKKFTSEGDKKVKVRVTLSDDTFKEFDIDIKVYEEKVILPEITVTKPVENKKPERGYSGFRKANKRVRRSLDKYNEVNESVKELEKLINDSKNNNFETKEETDVENLKNNILVKIEDAKEKLKKSYTEETEEEKLQEVKEKVLKEIEGLKEELNKIREKQVSNNEEKVEKPTLLKENKKQDTKSFNYFLILIPVSLIIFILILLKRRKKER